MRQVEFLYGSWSVFNDMKNVLLIINPRAGKTKAKSALFDIIDVFTENDMRVTVEITKYSGHAGDICKYVPGETDLVVCVGGDGTLNEVIDGMIESGKNIPIGYIPAGSTNDFATTLKLSKDIKKAALDIAKGVEKCIDVGRFDDRHFTYVASFGAFTRSSYSAPQSVKNVLGHLAYVLQGIQDIPSIKAEHARIVCDDGTTYEDDYIFGAVANSTSVGGIISFKEALVSMNDGKFELLLIKKPKNIVELNKCINALLTQNYSCDSILFSNIRSAVFDFEGSITWSLDGERADTDGHVKISNIKHAVNMILPKASESIALLSN